MTTWSRTAVLLVLGACAGHHAHPGANPDANANADGNANSTSRVQMNDLSVLFPLPQTQADLNAMLTPAANANGGQLLPETVVLSSESEFDASGMVLVAFRLDPCFGQLGAITATTTCNNQLRLVFEPVTFVQGSGASVADAAIHAFYSLTREQLVDAVVAIEQARQAAGGSADLGPLAPHPLIAQQGLTGTLAAQLEQIITQYAGAANFVRFTGLAVALGGGSNTVPTGPGEFWNFESWDVVAGSAVARQIPTLPASQPTNLMGVSVQTGPLSTTFSPATTSADNLDVLASYSQASTAGSAALGSAFDAALRIENPHDNSPDTIDCASCHMAPPAIQLVGAQLGLTPSGNADTFVPDASIPTADLAQTTMLVDSDQVLNLHAFSYRNASPMINQRVINETAANVAYVATLLP